MKYIIVIMSLVITNTALCQTSKTIIKKKGSDTFELQLPNQNANDKLEMVDSLPKFKGNMRAYLDKKTKEVNLSPSEKKLIKVKFIVDENGLVTNPTVLNAPNKLIDSISSQMVLDMPRWKPAIKDGKSVSSPYLIYIQF